MSLQTPGLHVEIAASNMSLYPAGVPRWGSNLEQLALYLEATGYRDFEIHPTNALMRDISRRQVSGDTEIIGSTIGSVHQTFNNGGDKLGIVADMCGVQRSTASVAGMAAIAEAVGRPIPGVYYTDGLSEDNPLPPHHAIFSVIQPQARVYGTYGADRSAGLMRRLAPLGIMGLCPDSVHIREHHAGYTLPASAEEVWADQFGSGRVFQVHVGAGRYDVGKRDPEIAATSEQEFRAFVSGSLKKILATEMGRMLVAAIESWKAPFELVRADRGHILRFVTEIPPRPWPFGRTEAHARFIDGLVTLIGKTGAIPLLRGNSA